MYAKILVAFCSLILSVVAEAQLSYRPLMRCEQGQVVLDAIHLKNALVGHQLVVNGNLLSEVKSRFFGPLVKYHSNGSVFVATTTANLQKDSGSARLGIGIHSIIGNSEIKLLQRYFTDNGTMQVDYIFRNCSAVK